MIHFLNKKADYVSAFLLFRHFKADFKLSLSLRKNIVKNIAIYIFIAIVLAYFLYGYIGHKHTGTKLNILDSYLIPTYYRL